VLKEHKAYRAQTVLKEYKAQMELKASKE